MNCPYCQKEIDPKAIKCPECHTFIIERKKDRKDLYLSVFINSAGVFFAVTLAILVSLVFVYNYYIIFEVRYNTEAGEECRINIDYLEKSLSLYETSTGESLKELGAGTVQKLTKVLKENGLNFDMPVCPLGGEYEIYDRNKVRCSLHRHKEE